jgi:aminoglycoside 6'-N-acetyltransferase
MPSWAMFSLDGPRLDGPLGQPARTARSDSPLGQLRQAKPAVGGSGSERPCSGATWRASVTKASHLGAPPRASVSSGAPTCPLGAVGWEVAIVLEVVPQLQGERVALRPLQEGDVPRLLELARDPSVARWWPFVDESTLLDKTQRTWAVEHEGALAGLAQAWEEDDPEFRHAGIDLYLGAEHQGRGLGVDVVRTVARYLLHDLGHHRLVIDPAAANERAIRCYERVGFRRVGILRRYQLAGDGSWMDGLLMDLLPEELS